MVYRGLTWDKFVKLAVTNSPVKTTAMVMILIACAGGVCVYADILSGCLSRTDRVPDLGLTDNPVGILLMINAALLILGMIMDMAALILICTPIFLPVAQSTRAWTRCNLA